MSKDKSLGLTAPKLRIILASLIVLTFILCIAGFLFFRTHLVAYAKQVQSTNATADASSDDIVRLQRLKSELADDSVAVTRAKNIVADSQYYQYQNQIISDLNTYAKNSGVSISGFTFSDASATAPATAPAAGAAAVAAPAGLKSITATVTVKNPVNYTAAMKFIHSIELNLTKMQLSGISFTNSAENKGEIAMSPITIEVYTR